MMGSSFLVFVSLFVVAFLFIWFECNSEDLFDCLLDRDAQIDIVRALLLFCPLFFLFFWIGLLLCTSIDD